MNAVKGWPMNETMFIMKNWIVFALMVLLTTPVLAQHKKRRVVKPKTNTTQVPVSTPTLINNSLVLCASIDSLPAWHLTEPADFKFPANFPAPTHYQLYGTIYKWFKSSLTTHLLLLVCRFPCPLPVGFNASIILLNGYKPWTLFYKPNTLSSCRFRRHKWATP